MADMRSSRIIAYLMRLTCPDCAAVYEVPTDRMRPGRRARCARCDATWVPELTLADLDTQVPESNPTQEPTAPVLRAAGSQPPAGTSALDRLAAAPAPATPQARSSLGL